MSFLDSMMGRGGQSPIQLVGELIDHEGGVEGILAKFKTAGFSEAVKSWLSNNRNQPLTVGQVQKALGSDVINYLASKTGFDASIVASQLAKYIPDMVDKLSPNGKLTQTFESSAGLVDIVKSIFNRSEGKQA